MLEAWRLRAAVEKQREESLREDLRALPDAERKAFYEAYQPRLRDPDTYAVLNWLFLAGLHHFYLGRWLRGLVNLAVMLGGLALLFVSPWAGFGLIVFVTLLEVPALLRSQLIVQHHNTREGERVLDALTSRGR